MLLMRVAPAWLFLGACAFFVVALAFVPERLRVLQYHALPPWPVVVGLAAYFVIAVATRRVAARRLVHGVLAFVLLAIHLAVAAQPLGDSVHWRQLAETDVLALSEPLANLTFRVARLFGPQAIELVPPLAGALFAFVLLGVAERALVGARTARAAGLRVVIAATLVLGGWQLVFARNYVENPPVSLPLLVVGLGSLARYARSDGASVARPVARPAAWLTLATLAHGMNAAMLPALLWCMLLKHPGRSALPALLRALAVAAATAIATVAATLGALWACGFELGAGHVTGGGDDRLFVPLHVPAGTAYEFAMFDLAHAADVGNILLLASPLALAALAGVLHRRWRRALAAAVRAQPAFAIAGLGGLGSAAVFYFDLGFPRDYDLMVGMSAPANLLLLQAAACAPRRLGTVVWAGLALQGVHTLLVTSSLLVLPQHAPRDGECLLTVNRRVGELAIRPGEWLFVELRPPPAASLPVEFSLWLHRAPPAPGASLAAGARSFALPGEPGHDAERTTLLLSSRERGMFGLPVPALAAPWLGFPAPYFRELGVQTVQASFEDRAGRISTSNTVVLRAP